MRHPLAVAGILLVAASASVQAQVIDERVRTRVEQGAAESIERLYAAVEPEPGEVEALAQELADALKDRERDLEALRTIRERLEVGLLALHSILTSEDAKSRAKAANAAGRIAQAEQILEWEAPDLSETVLWLLLLSALEHGEVARFSAKLMSDAVPNHWDASDSWWDWQPNDPTVRELTW